MARRNTAASKKAAELSAGFAAREEELQKLAVEFFDLEEKSDYGSVQKRIHYYQQKLEELQSLSKEAKAELFAQQAPIILAMKRVGESPANIAKRLDISLAVVKQALRAEKDRQAVVGEDEFATSEDTHHELAEISTRSNNEERNYHESSGE